MSPRPRSLSKIPARTMRLGASVLMLASLAAAAPQGVATAKIEATARGLLDDPDARVRGEAGLVLATLETADAFDANLNLSKDSDVEAAVRGTVALGILGEPGVEVRLTNLLTEARGNPGPNAIAAGLALGLLQDEHAGAGVQEYLARFQQMSYRRHGAILAALLAGLHNGEHPDKTAALRELLDDTAIRDSDIQALLWSLLLRAPNGVDDDRIKEGMRSRAVFERIAAIECLTRRDEALPKLLLRKLERVARRDAHGAVRAAALRCLTRHRHLPALELAAEAAQSHQLDLATAGTTSAVRLGGRAMARALEGRILATKKATLQAALLRALPPPHSAPFVDGCRKIALRAKTTTDVRCAAAEVVLRAGHNDVLPVLRTLFVTEQDPDLLHCIARAMASTKEPFAALDRLLPAGEPNADRLAALLAVGHPDAEAEWLLRVQRKRAPAAERAALLRSWRLARKAVLPASVTGRLPVRLRAILN